MFQKSNSVLQSLRQQRDIENIRSISFFSRRQ